MKDLTKKELIMYSKIGKNIFGISFLLLISAQLVAINHIHTVKNATPYKIEFEIWGTANYHRFESINPDEIKPIGVGIYCVWKVFARILYGQGYEINSTIPLRIANPNAEKERPNDWGELNLCTSKDYTVFLQPAAMAGAYDLNIEPGITNRPIPAYEKPQPAMPQPMYPPTQPVPAYPTQPASPTSPYPQQPPVQPTYPVEQQPAYPRTEPMYPNKPSVTIYPQPVVPAITYPETNQPAEMEQPNMPEEQGIIPFVPQPETKVESEEFTKTEEMPMPKAEEMAQSEELTNPWRAFPKIKNDLDDEKITQEDLDKIKIGQKGAIPLNIAYAVLGVSQDSSMQDIEEARRRLIRQWHPDKNSTPIATEVFKIIQAAYAKLTL